MNSEYQLTHPVLRFLPSGEERCDFIAGIAQTPKKTRVTAVFANGTKSVSTEILLFVDVGDGAHQRTHYDFRVVVEVHLRKVDSTL